MLLACPFALAAALLQPAWVEEFDDADLDPAWHWVAPVAGPTWSLTERPGVLRLHVPQREKGYCLWPGVREAPLLLREAPAGDWRAEARLEPREWGDGSCFHLALAAFSATGSFIGWGPLRGPEEREPLLALEYMGAGRVVTAPLEPGPVEIALEKRGCRYECFVRRDGAWRSCGATEFPLPPASVGLLGKTWGSGPAVAADLDRISVEPLGPSPTSARARVVVHVGQPRHPLRPFLYGQFIEHLNECVYGGIWAERLRNRKFAGRANDGVAQEWERVGEPGGAEPGLDSRVTYGPGQSQRIRITRPGEQGFRQRGIVLEAGRAYSLRAVVRGNAGPATLALGDGQGRQAEAPVAVGLEWTTTELRLTAARGAADGWLSLTASAPGTLWVAAVSLMPADHVGGLRRDTLELLRELAPPILRWPGGNFASGYHWEDGIGEPDRRPTRWERAWGQWETNDFGTEEFLHLCREIGAVPYICANLGEGTPREAAEWVEYCNGATETAFGGLRAANGHPEAHGVRVWGLGNEMWGDWQLGHLPPELYAAKAVETARAMRARSPVALEFVGVGVREDERAQWADWNQRTVPLLAHECAYHSIHTYPAVWGGDGPENRYLEQVQSVRRLAGVFARSIEAVERATPEGATPPAIAVDEWATHNDACDIGDALAACGLFHAFERAGERLTMATQTLTVNVMAPIRTDQTHVARTPLFHAAHLATERAGMSLVPCTVDCAPFTAPIPSLDVAAALSEDRRTLVVSVANYHPVLEAELALRLEDFAPGPMVIEQQLTGTGRPPVDPLEGREGVVRLARERALAEVLSATLPPQSVTQWRFAAGE